jgi:hypothetical protein
MNTLTKAIVLGIGLPALQLAPLSLSAAEGFAVGQVVFHVIGRNQVVSTTGPGAGTAVAMGYLAAIEGIDAPLFSDPKAMGEGTAFFTVKSEPHPFSTLANGNTKVRMRPPGGIFHVYYDETPDGDFTKPDTWSDGESIATFRIGSTLATKVDNVATEIDSAELVSSKDFTFHGHKYNFKRMVPHGVTFFLSGPGTQVAEEGPGAGQFAFSGTAVANGAAPK